VPLLFGTIPSFLLSMQGEINMDLDEFSVNLLKKKSLGQPLLLSPEVMYPSNEELLQSLLYNAEDKTDKTIGTYLDKETDFLA